MAKESKWKFEFICFQRWLVLLRFMEDYHIEFIAALDHDFLLFTNMTEYVQAHPTHTDLYLSFLPPRISAHCSIMSQRALKEIDQFIRVGMTKLRLAGDNQVYNDMWFLRYYSYKAINDRLHLRNETFDYDEQCWVVRSKQDCREYSRFGSAFPWSQLQTSHVPVSLAKSETYLAPVVRYEDEQFNSTYGEETVNGVKYRRDLVFDHNFNYEPEQQYAMNEDRTKVVFWVNHFLYFRRFDSLPLIPALGLHFQGGKKVLMHRFVQKRRPRLTDPPCLCEATRMDDCRLCR